MKVLHIESGLGNQMLDFCDYLAVKKMNPEQECYIENIIYEIPECNEIICQWNGYELERIFGIKVNSIKDLFSYYEWEEIIEEIKKTDFWNKKWNYPKYFVNVLNEHNMALKNRFGDFEVKSKKSYMEKLILSCISSPFCQALKRMLCRIKVPLVPVSPSFEISKDNTFEGHTLCYMYKGAGIERIEDEIREIFVFPEICDEKNIRLSKKIQSENAVSLHLRRGDGLKSNEKYYKRGYYRKAVRYIRQQVKNPVFYIFSDPGSIKWAKQNLKELNLENCEVHYVDWNKGENSYRDMQLMSMCKHNIISFSSFSWWASYLNTNKEKITISPEPKILTTHWI